MGFVAAAVAVTNAAIQQAAQRERMYEAMSPEQKAAYRQARADAEALKDRTRAAKMFSAAAKSATDCPWKRFRKPVGGDV